MNENVIAIFNSGLGERELEETWKMEAHTITSDVSGFFSKLI
jgi:hypothetical protein